MAKQLVNPFERHVEKLVLAIAGLMLVGVMWRYVFSSPNKIQLGSEPATPGVVDTRLAQKANEILERIRTAKPTTAEHEPKFEQFVQSLTPLKALELPLVSAMGPEMPLVDSPDVPTGGAKLVEIPAPQKIFFTQGRNTLVTSSPQGGDVRTPVDWVMLSFPIDVKAISELQRKAWGATQLAVIFAPPEVQRRMMKSDGSWSDSDWQTVATSPSFKMPTPPTIRLTESNGKVVANKDDQKAAQKYQEDIADPKIQLQILRPLPPVFTKDESPWKFPIVSSYENVVKMDQEFLTPNNPAAPIEDRYGGTPTDTGKAKPEPTTPAQVLNKELEDARAQMELGRQRWSPNEVTLAYNRALEVSSAKEASADLKAKAQKLMKEAEQLVVDIKHNPKGPGGLVGGPKSGETVVKAREKMPIQEIWAFDAGVDSIANGATYQFRVRARVLNRLAGVPESFAKPTDAQTIIVAGAWSEPTEPIHIPESSWFFVTREDKPKREIYAEFFRWYDGVWVKSNAANFQEGTLLVHEERVSVPSIADRTVAEKPTVPFGEDLTLLDIEFALPMRERKSGSNPMTVKFAGQPTPATAAVFVNGKGDLQERVVAIDKENPMKRDIKPWIPPKKSSTP